MTAQPIAVFTADNHLRPNTWSKHPDLYGDSYVALRQIADYCARSQLPLILLGDLFDKNRPDPCSVGHYLHITQRLQQANLAVYYIEGNHETADVPWASLSPWAWHAGAFEISGISFKGLDFTPAGLLQQEIDSSLDISNPVDVLLTHQSWLEIQRVGSTDGSFSMLPYGVTVLTGDYHVCGEYTGTAKNGGIVKAYSPGSTAMQALNEPPKKYFGVIYDDLSVEFKQIESRPFIAHKINNEEEMQQWVAGFDQELESIPQVTHPDIQKPVAHICYRESIPEAYQRIRQVVADKAHLFLSPRSDNVVQVVNMSADDSFSNLISAVEELTRTDPETGQRVKRLLTSNDPKSELLAMYNEHLSDFNKAGVLVDAL